MQWLLGNFFGPSKSSHSINGMRGGMENLRHDYFLNRARPFLADVVGCGKKTSSTFDGKNRPFRICAYACTPKAHQPPAEDGCGW
jgi:hypothetical protein